MLELRFALLSVLALAAGCTGGEASPRVEADPPGAQASPVGTTPGRDLAAIDV